ncbi:UNVERIFIED_CONTAM: hypothetical protein BEN50_25900 [Euhalothece sp. KZN 001]
MRVRLSGGEPGSLNPTCPVRPMPRSWMSIPPASVDGLFVPLAVGGDFLGGQRAVGNVHVLRIDVDVVEEMLVHEPDVALQLVRLHGEVLVEVERDHVLERQPLFLVQADELVVHAGGRGARREAQHGGAVLGGPLADELGDPPGDGEVHLLRVFVNVRFDPLSADHLEHGALSAGKGGTTEYSPKQEVAQGWKWPVASGQGLVASGWWSVVGVWWSVSSARGPRGRSRG